MNNLPPLSDEIKNKINGLISEKLGIDLEDFNEQSNIWDDLGMDMLDEVELIMELEKNFGIIINDEHCADNKTVADVYETVNITLTIKSLYEGLTDDETKNLDYVLKNKDVDYHKAVNFRQSIGRTNRNVPTTKITASGVYGKFPDEVFDSSLDIYPNNESSRE